MSAAELRCPRCKKTFAAASGEDLAAELLAHLRAEHGHEPPREHVIARIGRRTS